MTTRVPGGTPDAAVEDIGQREAARWSELAGQGHLLRLCTLPGHGRALGLWQAGDTAAMQSILASLQLDAWTSVDVTPLSPHPSHPALANC